jgi:hypothetical protein
MDKLVGNMKVVGKDDSKTLKGEERSDNTVKQYLKRLVKLNNDKPFTNLKFLVDKDAIANVIKDKAESTQISYYSAVIVALSTSKTYKKLKEEYQELVAPKREALNDKDVHEKTEKEKEVMISMEEVTTIKNKLKEEVEELNKKKTLTEQEYDKYLQYVLVSLYTDIAPRRNMDYTYMVILKKRPSEMNNTKNYLLLDEKKFVFNTYKTKREHGSQELDIPEILMKTINQYCKARVDMKKFNSKSAEVPLLVHYDGKEVYRSNGITKILNKVFGKNVACTALRHIYLSDKYADVTKERMKDASDMAHSITTQNSYVKF